MKCIICAIAKLENEYVYEWARYHLDLGFSIIHIFDNNDVDGERIADVFSGTDCENRVIIHDVRGQRFVQKKVYQDCYENESFDWCAFIDIDEFITFAKPSNIQNIEDYLSKMNEWDAIHVNWKCYGDCGKARKTDAPVLLRFKRPKLPNSFRYTYYNIPENKHIKSIIKKGLPINWTTDNENFQSNPHTPYGLTTVCSPSGIKVDNQPFARISHEVLFIRHYTTKTVEEYLDKIKRQCADCDNTVFYSYSKFFRMNRPTIKKMVWLKHNCPSVKVRACIHEYLKFLVLNFNLPFRGLYKSL